MRLKTRRSMYQMVGCVALTILALTARADDLFDVQLDNIQITEPSAPIIDIEEPLVSNEKEVDWNYKSIDAELKCLADNIYFEGWQEPEQGQYAIALVTINRVKSGLYPRSVCGVVWQKNRNKRTGKMTAQFSWTLDGRPDVPKNLTAWEKCLEIAEMFLANNSLNNISDFTEGATHYHAVYVKPAWRKTLQKVGRYGLHVFYK